MVGGVEEMRRELVEEAEEVVEEGDGVAVP